MGCSTSEIEQYILADEARVNGYGLTGCQRSMFANRISFSFDFNGPSYAVDTACSSSISAMSRAFSDLQAGHCDAAIVAGTNIILSPATSLQHKRLGKLDANGKCMSFDANGAGYVRSEACVVIYIQRATKARRIYATVLNVRTNTDGCKQQDITHPDGQMQNRLINETYKIAGVRGADVAYIEAHGTGNANDDSLETNLITEFFCKNRQTPLLIGSVKSNMGHSETASGICSIAKILIAMESGIIPGNLHFKSPNAKLIGIRDGSLKVVDKNISWNGGIVGVNSFGFGGANGHVILKSFDKAKAPALTVNDLPRLVIASGRSNEAVLRILAAAEKHKDDAEYLALINKVHEKNIPLHGYRGFAIVGGSAATLQDSQTAGNTTRQIWFAYSGMGTQATGVAKDLMKIDVFHKSIEKSADILRAKGLDLIDLITTNDQTLVNNVINSNILITAVQVALTDLLLSLEISPDGIIGLSLGEIACGYADGCFTHEQTLLAAYWRGKSLLDTESTPGVMAVVALSWEKCLHRIPSDLVLACHHSAELVSVHSIRLNKVDYTSIIFIMFSDFWPNGFSCKICCHCCS